MDFFESAIFETAFNLTVAALIILLPVAVYFDLSH
jgi:hypothetical protein